MILLKNPQGSKRKSHLKSWRFTFQFFFEDLYILYLVCVYIYTLYIYTHYIYTLYIYIQYNIYVYIYIHVLSMDFHRGSKSLTGRRPTMIKKIKGSIHPGVPFNLTSGMNKKMGLTFSPSENLKKTIYMAMDKKQHLPIAQWYTRMILFITYIGVQIPLFPTENDCGCFIPMITFSRANDLQKGDFPL